MIFLGEKASGVGGGRGEGGGEIVHGFFLRESEMLFSIRGNEIF